jgi:hypothetical protein
MTNDRARQVLATIDLLLTEASGRELFSSSELVDKLLDIRALLRPLTIEEELATLTVAESGVVLETEPQSV